MTTAFLGNHPAKEALRKFLESSSQHFLLLIGPSGGGKTSLSHLAIQEWGGNMQVLRPTYEDFTNHKEFREYLGKFINMRNMLEIFERKSKLLFLDDVDTLLTQDRYANAFIIDLINHPKPGLKVLMTCCSGDEKKVSEIRKRVLTERISNPNATMITSFLKERFSNDLIGINSERLDMYVRLMHNNVRNCMLNIKMIRGDVCDLHNEDIHRLTFDKNICDTVEAIFQKAHLQAKDLEVCLSADPSLISYIMYDNFPKYMHKDAGIHDLKRVLQAFAVGSHMETSLHSKSDWILNDICNLYRCGVLKQNVSHLPACPAGSECITYTTITTRASNYYNMIKRVGEHQSAHGLSYQAMLRFYEIDPKTKAAGAKKHKEDSSINNYLKKIYSNKRASERNLCIHKCIEFISH